jgi:outer membrane protein OmpA-like peptidoglycan-associated protein
MSGKITGSLLIALLLAPVGAPAAADDMRGGEVGVVLGAISPDEEMTGDSSSTEVTLGLRGGAVFTSRWGWFIDGLYSSIGTRTGLGDGRTVIGRTGVDLLFNPHRDARWLVSVGAGWMVVDYEDASTEDFHNPIASIGFGQRIRLAGNRHLRWELRGDRTLDDARLADDLVQGHAMLGFSWGPGGEARPGSGLGLRPGKPLPDADEDGVRDKRDRCPGTPPGAVVDSQGCPLDGDRDGVPDGIDRCPRSRTGDAIGPDGCPADSDGDGVPDLTDVCTDTPARAQIDEWGCPKDGDGDGVYDGLDQCPDTPGGARVDGQGCPEDSDDDGVYDGLDRCPRTPARVPVDPRGCALDGDGDGVHDGIDACPDTPAGTRVVDARGCARAARLFEEGQTELVLTGVWFESDSAALNSVSRTALDRVARSLRDHEAVRVEIGAHTDSSGADAYNMDLSVRRAEAVRTYLIGQGVDPDRLVARGFGETRPITDNATEDGRSRNRRVDLKVVE